MISSVYLRKCCESAVRICEKTQSAVPRQSTKPLSMQGIRFYSSDHDDIIVEKKGKLLTLTLNRPERYNAINIKNLKADITGIPNFESPCFRQMYHEITDILNQAAKDDEVSVLKLTGSGEYYSSGNDLKDLLTIPPAEMPKAMKDGGVLLENFVESFVRFPKILVAAVNGPAVGITVTTLGLCDVVYACDTATFLTPFSKTGQSPEACASYTFPKLLGHSRAADMLCFGRKFTAQELERSLVTKVFPASTFQEGVDREIQNMLSLPFKSLLYTKDLMRAPERDILLGVNKKECERLLERWTSIDFINALMQFSSKQ